MPSLKHCFVLLTCTIKFAYAQPVTWSSPVAISGINGYESPHIIVTGNTPVLSFGDFTNGNINLQHYVAGSFTPPIQVNPANFPTLVSSNGGFNIASKNDTVYITYIDQNLGHVFLQCSFDGGYTFSDTIRVDNISNSIPQYPSVAINKTGHPIISYASLDTNFLNPQYLVTRSFDFGNTFQPAVSATSALGANPCDCCPGSVVANDNKVAVIFRGSQNDLRDMRAAISLDTANSFIATAMIDNNGWIYPSCPSSGGQGIFNGDTLISVFMNGLNNNACYLSTYNVITGQPGFEKNIFAPPGSGIQEVIRIAASGDTIGAVWDQEINGQRNILFSFSTTGAQGLGTYIDTVSDVVPFGFHLLPDLAYKNGKFHLVFSDYVTLQLYYMEGSVNTTSAISSNSAYDLNPAVFADQNRIILTSNAPIKGPYTITAYAMDGKSIDLTSQAVLIGEHKFQIQHHLSHGLYVINFSCNQSSYSLKLLIN